jgi:fructan beta-fructosidase
MIRTFLFNIIRTISVVGLLLSAIQCQNTASLVSGTKPMAQSEPHRPMFHFTPQKAWMNDPNGMVYYEGEYHLFYQYYPDSTVWGPMHWGHAVSRDLVTWEHLPIALYPDSLGLIFSGSTVVDWKNTSGFGTNGKPPLVAMFTHHLMAGEKAGRHDFQYQSLAYSNDKGRTWTKYAGNPVIPNTAAIHDFRDTKVVWHEESKKWIVVFAIGKQVTFYSSPNLKDWTHLSDWGEGVGAHGGVWECPDLFPIKVEGTGAQKWVLMQNLNPGGPNGGSGVQYFIGDFDGKTFKLDPKLADQLPLWLDYGRDNYAGVTWSDVPASDGRRLFIGWMSNWDYAQVVPTKAWRSATTLPRSIKLVQTEKGLRLSAEPIAELQKLRKKAYTIPNQTVSGTTAVTQKLGFKAATLEVELELEFAVGAQTKFWVEMLNTKGEVYRIGYDAKTNQFVSDRTKSGKNDFSPKFAANQHIAPRLKTNQTVKMHLYFDRASCELFSDDGLINMTEIFFPNEDYSILRLNAEGGSAEVVSGKVWVLGE